MHSTANKRGKKAQKSSSFRLSDMVRFARKESGLTLDEVAHRLGLKSRSSIHVWETGGAEPSIARACEILRAMGYDLEITLRKRA